ncbi:MAG: HEAT repeat domain-containing protein [Chloroflexota bacterium]
MPALDDLLADLTSGDETRAEAAAHDLAGMGEAALPALRRLLDSGDEDHRWWALCALAQSPHTRTEDLLPFLDDPAPEIRQAAALGLGNHADEAAIRPLVQALGDADSLVSTLACNALVAIGSACVPFILEMPRGAPQLARINATRALAEIADPRAIPALMAAVEDESVMVQHWAEEGLERLGLDMVYLKPE